MSTEWIQLSQVKDAPNAAGLGESIEMGKCSAAELVISQPTQIGMLPGILLSGFLLRGKHGGIARISKDSIGSHRPPWNLPVRRRRAAHLDWLTI